MKRVSACGWQSRSRTNGGSVRAALLGLAGLVAAAVPWAARSLGAAPADAGGTVAAETGLRFVILGDRTGSATPGVYESIVDEVALLRPDFAVTVGDQIEGYTEDPSTLRKQWDEYMTIASRLAAPLYPCAGNHDITSAGMVDAWKLRTGREPCYSFDQRGVHFVFFDTGRWESSREWMDRSGYREWLDGDLKSHSTAPLTVVFFHKPYWYDTLADGRPDPLHDLFRKYGVDLVFNGHYHNYGAAEYDGIRYTIVGSSGGGIGGEDEGRGVFFQYLWCTVRGSRLDWALIQRGAVRPPDMVQVADLKFLDKVAGEYVRLTPMEIGETSPSEMTDCVVSIRNATPAHLRAALQWEVPPNWRVEPPAQEMTLDPSAGAGMIFKVRLAGDFYPLPTLRMPYPYRPGKTYTFEERLPALRTQRVARLTGAPVIDGSPEEAVWAAASKADRFGSPDGGPCTIEPTVIRFGQFGRSLYIAATCSQADMGSLAAAAKERDGQVTRDDCVGFFFCPEPAETTFYQVYFNPDGVVFDQRVVVQAPGGYGGEGPKWNGEYEVATRKGTDSWTLEAAIPFAELRAAAPAPGDRWRVNFRRKEMSKGSSADWQYPIGYVPSRFGYLAFE